MSEPLTKKYWFAAKRYGLGWGLPLTWQGWVTLGGYFLLLGATHYIFPPALAPIQFSLLVLSETVLLVVICYRTGEPLRWRWGK